MILVQYHKMKKKMNIMILNKNFMFQQKKQNLNIMVNMIKKYNLIKLLNIMSQMKNILKKFLKNIIINIKQKICKNKYKILNKILLDSLFNSFNSNKISFKILKII